MVSEFSQSGELAKGWFCEEGFGSGLMECIPGGSLGPDVYRVFEVP